MNKFQEKISSLIAWRPFFFYSVTLLKTPHKKNLYKNPLINIKIVWNQKKIWYNTLIFIFSFFDITNKCIFFLLEFSVPTL